MENRTGESIALVREMGLPIHQSKGWLKFLGMMSVIQGIFAALTIFGIIIAWLSIWIGVLLYQSATIIERAYISGDRYAYIQAMNKLKTYFMIQGVLTLIGLVVAIIALSMGLLGALLNTIL